MNVGFTGTRKGMSEKQLDQCGQVLMWLERATSERATPWFHHGGADGADTEADRLAVLDGYAVKVHPCPGVEADDEVGANGRGKFNNHDAEWDEVFPPLVRNKRIVDAVDILIAAPETDKEELRSGTWATVRYARKKGIPIIFLSRGEQ